MTVLAVLAMTMNSGCGYWPTTVARGEITATAVGGQYHLHAGGRKISSTWRLFAGLESYVRCVPEAQRHARLARRFSAGALVTSIFSGVVAVTGFTMFLADGNYGWSLLGNAVAALLLFPVAALRGHANGHAIDTMNYYNDRVGSLGATCDDPVYPPPAALLPPPPSKPL